MTVYEQDNNISADPGSIVATTITHASGTNGIIRCLRGRVIVNNAQTFVGKKAKFRMDSNHSSSIADLLGEWQGPDLELGEDTYSLYAILSEQERFYKLHELNHVFNPGRTGVAYVSVDDTLRVITNRGSTKIRHTISQLFAQSEEQRYPMFFLSDRQEEVNKFKEKSYRFDKIPIEVERLYLGR